MNESSRSAAGILTPPQRSLADQIEALGEASDLGEGKWSSGIAGNCNLVGFNGDDIVGIGHIHNVDRRELVCLLRNNLPAIIKALSARSESTRRWITVSERLPEQRIRVLGYDGLVIEDCFYGVSSNRSDADWSEVTWRRTGYEDHFRATHWMPLPEAPK